MAAKAAEAARASGESLGAFVARAVALEIERERAEKFFAERRDRADLASAMDLLNRSGGASPSPEDALPAGYKRR
ncbi:MAG TPA: hypothetical protein PLK37_08670 [Terricaulis sp.]|nr:hypothetical protein [Terricaulis sp.]